MINGAYYRFTSERASYKSIAQLCDGRWFLIGEEDPVSLYELEQRGWELDTEVEDMEL